MASGVAHIKHTGQSRHLEKVFFIAPAKANQVHIWMLLDFNLYTHLMFTMNEP